MSLVVLSNLSLSFGAVDIFRGVTAAIAHDSKIGLIGPNGIGKTSLLLMLAGLSAPTTGQVAWARGKRFGYLRQEAVEAFGDRDNTLWAEMLTVFADLRTQEDHLRGLEARMAAGDHSPDLLAEYGACQLDFEHAGGYTYEQRIKRTLHGLGLDDRTHALPVRVLSGGQKTRALLAKLLLEQPDLLILDEPTNHLDAEAVEWLETTLADWPGAVLVVSHDRYFLDNVVNTIWEMSRTGLESYRGHYTAYLTQRAERFERQAQIFAEEKARLQKEIDFVQRNMARDSTNARAVGKLKNIHRDLLIIENYGIGALRSGRSWSDFGLSLPASVIGVVEAIRQINALEPPSQARHLLKLALKPAQRSGDRVLRTTGLRVGYPNNPLFTAPDVELWRGDCVAIIGPNGAGKTTLLKTLLGQLPPLVGTVQWGASLKVGYFAQAHDALNLDNTVLQELLRHREMDLPKARHHLAHYLFRGEDIDKPVRALSGGERGRLALALLALEGANLLLLDEPTNHLDIPAQEILQAVLQDYGGTILLVSHDRYLIDALATQLWEVRGGALTVFTGRYRDWVAQRSAPAATLTAKVPAAPAAKPAPPPRANPAADRQRAKRLAALEEKIALREATLAALNDGMQAAGNDFARARELSEDYAYTQAELDSLLAEWEALVGS